MANGLKNIRYNFPSFSILGDNPFNINKFVHQPKWQDIILDNWRFHGIARLIYLHQICLRANGNDIRSEGREQLTHIYTGI